MSESTLVSYTNLTRNYSRRTENISKVTVHHAAAVHPTCRTLVDYFATTARAASANYCIGNDGSIGQSVSESSRAWTSSSAWNDQRAVTIEVSNSAAGEPWPVSAKAYASLVRLAADICRRNGIPAVAYDGTKGAALTEHRMFAATACPGTTLHGYLESGKLAADVNAAIAADGGAYCLYGLDYAPVFDPAYYGGKYPDLSAAGLSGAAQLFRHFVVFGMGEARKAHPDFDVRAYRSSNKDLDEAFGDDWEAYYKHYVMFGRQEIAEGRRRRS